MDIAVLALQGAFIEHEARLERMGASVFEVRQASDWERRKDALVIPGGESTTQGKLLRDLGLLEPIADAIRRGLPVLGTCAGLILLARDVAGQGKGFLGTMDIVARRNAYGRQLGSFHAVGRVEGVGEDVPMTFIRAPYIEAAGDGVEVLAEVDGRLVAAREGHQLVTAFHPELDDDCRMHEYFLAMVREAMG